jgi:hypothetical protein
METYAVGLQLIFMVGSIEAVVSMTENKNAAIHQASK